MSEPLLARALASGASIVTPNNRLARDIVARFDAARHAEGARAWSAARALPWTMWLDRLWLAALAAHAHPAPRALFDQHATQELWYTVVAADRRDLLSARGAARLAAEAWALFHAWRDSGERLANPAMAVPNEDAVVFSEWAARYRSRLDELDALDTAQLPDVLSETARAAWIAPLGPVALYGFIALTAQQRRLLAALRTAGMTIDEVPAFTPVASIRRRTAIPNTALELVQALNFARARVEANADARIAIVIADLEARRDEVVALAEEILCPEHLLSVAPDAPRPYGISLGEPLASVPLVACALDLVALACGNVPATTAASVIRTPFLPDARTHWKQRAEAERHWLGLGQREVGWRDVVAALRQCDPSLHRRFNALTQPSPARRLPRDWARAWSDWLAALGWPGTATLTSAQWQAREAWAGALARFAASGTIAGMLPADAALDSLRTLFGETQFQPEAAPAPIRILGVLEAAGLSFDGAWLAGFDANRWPPAAHPNPFLPLAWQQARGVPRAHPDTALTQARQLTAALGGIAPEVIASHAAVIDDAPADISPLFAAWESIDAAQLPRFDRLTDMMCHGAMERWSDRGASLSAPGARMRGGAGLFESQSACPFQAYARYRLDTDAWSACPDGLSPQERGEIVHAMLKAFWDNVHDHATLIGLDATALTASIDAAVLAGRDKMTSARWQSLAPAVAHAETMRLAATLRAWLDEAERPRPPFRVRAHEQVVDFELDGIALRARVDRVDELAPGALAIIDYKSGRAVRPVRWFAPRPEGIQLALYAHALRTSADAPVRALAFAQLKAGAIAVAGLTEQQALWPALDVVGEGARVPAISWQNAQEQLRDRLAMLASEIRDGVADVSPRNQTTCRHCGMHSLCRIQLLDDRADEPDAATADE